MASELDKDGLAVEASNRARRSRRVACFVFSIVTLPIVVPAVFLAFYSIDRIVISGAAYGFGIGQSKIEAYQIAQKMFNEEEIIGLESIADREDVLRVQPWLSQEFFELAEVQGRFDQWDHWGLWLDAEEPQLLAIVRWDGGAVSGVGKPGALWSVWRPEGQQSLAISEGNTHEEVFHILSELSQASGYERLVVRTGWMAQRQPVDLLDDEFRFVEPYDNWFILFDEHYLNTIQLSFSDDKLRAIVRNRQLFELP